jgi:kinesin family protein 2/24
MDEFQMPIHSPTSSLFYQTMYQQKEARKQEHLKNIAAGNPGDVDFIGMVDAWRRENLSTNPNVDLFSPRSGNICIAVRKRPVSSKENAKKDHDSVSCSGNKVWIHSAKVKVDGITKYLTHNPFQLDFAFGEDSTTRDIYLATTLPLVDHLLQNKGRATVFCYGQTGSGKTYTMNGIQHILAHDLYGQLQGDNLEITVAFFELYGGYVQDLLHGRNRCKLLEDGKGEVNITGLQEVPADSPEQFLQIIEEGHSQRTTQKTEANDTSSRSHAICQVFLRSPNGRLQGKLGLVDLAGSERGNDTKQHNSQRRAESADINTSLLALKECIRALGQKSTHVPYRGSKLTLILKDCFSPDSKTSMISTISPGCSSADHSLNTLRYADRIKEQRVSVKKSRKIKSGPSNRPSQERLQRIANVTEQATEESFQEQEEGLSDTSIVKDEEAYEMEPDLLQENDHQHEEELRKTVQQVFELEEALLNQHMSNIQDNAEMLTKEGKLLQKISSGSQNNDVMDNYAIELAEYLDRKEALIYKLQGRLKQFQHAVTVEQELAQQV